MPDFDLKGIIGVKRDDEKEFQKITFKKEEDEKTNDSTEESEDDSSADEQSQAESEGGGENESGSEESSSEEVSVTEDSEDSSEESADDSSSDEQEESEQEESVDPEEQESEASQAPNIYEITYGVFETEEELKSTSRLLKEHPELKGMLDYYEKNGTLLPYLQATQIDPDNFSDEEIIWQAFRGENAEFGLSDQELRLMFEEDVLSKYEADSEDESRVKIGAARMKKDAAKYRKDFKEDLAALLLPKERDVQGEAAEALEKQAAQKKEANKNKLAFQIRKEIKDGKIDVKLDDKNSVKLDVSPRKISELLESISDPSFLFDAEGKNFDIKRMAILADPDAFVKSVMKTSAAQGKADFVQEELKGRDPKSKKQQPSGGVDKIIGFDPKNPASFKGIKNVRSY